MKAMEKDAMMDKGEKMMDTDMKKEDTMMKSGVYTSYSPELVGKTDKTVLFFHASWCPSCRAADSGINADKIPEGLSILKVDYDNSTDLKKKYEVLSQHTFVQVDKNGNMLGKWAGGTKVSDITENLK
jgi:thiol-disulfide isomerase/thioredoxin